jgi:hypothetical protein
MEFRLYLQPHLGHHRHQQNLNQLKMQKECGTSLAPKVALEELVLLHLVVNAVQLWHIMLGIIEKLTTFYYKVVLRANLKCYT